MTLIEAIKSRRGTQTLAAFGESLGVTKQRVWQWEHGDCKPPVDLLQKMGITVEYLLDQRKDAQQLAATIPGVTTAVALERETQYDMSPDFAQD